MYCKDCYYDLRGSEGECPECGRVFDRGDAGTFYKYSYGDGGGGWLFRSEAERQGYPKKIRNICWVSILIAGLFLLVGWFFKERFYHISDEVRSTVLGVMLLVYILLTIVAMGRVLRGVLGWACCDPVTILLFLFLMGHVVDQTLPSLRRARWTSVHSEIKMNLFYSGWDTSSGRPNYGCVGDPISWEFDDIVDWLRRRAELGGGNITAFDEFAGYPVKLVSVDSEKIIYRYLGHNRVDNGGLRDDRDMSFDVKGILDNHVRAHGKDCQAMVERRLVIKTCRDLRDGIEELYELEGEPASWGFKDLCNVIKRRGNTPYYIFEPFVLISVDHNFVTYRHLGKNRIDDGGLKDDIMIPINLNKVRVKRAEYLNSKGGV